MKSNKANNIKYYTSIMNTHAGGDRTSSKVLVVRSCRCKGYLDRLTAEQEEEIFLNRKI